MALGYRDSEYWTGDYGKMDYSGVQPGNNQYLDSEYLTEFYLDESTLVKPQADGTYVIQDLNSGRTVAIDREGMSDALASPERDKTAFDKAVERSLDNNFGYNSLGSMRTAMEYAAKAPGMLGMPGKVATSLDNQNNNLATNAARQALGLDPVEHGIMGQFGNNKGVVGNVTIGDETFEVNLNPDPKNPAQLSPQQALDKAAELGASITEAPEAPKGATQKGLLGRAVDAVKDTAKSIMGNPKATEAKNFKTAAEVAGVNTTNPSATTPSNQSVQSTPSQGVTRGPSLGVAATGDDLGVTPSNDLGFSSPMGSLGSRTTSGFGTRSAPATGKGTVGSSNHKGVDLSTPAREAIADTTNKNYAGAPLSTPGAGTVTNAGYSASYGNFVDVSHPNGYTSRLAHMAPDTVTVSVGDQIAAGTPVGQMGTTGNSQAAHAHFEMRDPLGNLIDPATVIDFDKNPSVATPGVKPDQVQDEMSLSMANVSPELSGVAGYTAGIDPNVVDATYDNFSTMNPIQDVQTTMASPQSIANMSIQDAVNAGLAPSTFGGFTTQNTAMGLMGAPTEATSPATTARSVETTSVSPSSVSQTNLGPTTNEAFGVNQNATASTPAGPMSAQSFSNMGLGYGYSPKDVEKMSMAIAGELSPSSLRGVQAQDPQALAELAGVVSTMNNRVNANVNMKMTDPVAAALSPNNYNSLGTKALGTTMANFSAFGASLSPQVQGLLDGTITAPTEMANQTHYANMSISSPGWAETQSFKDTAVQANEHTFGIADNMYSGISPDAGIGYSASQNVSDVSTGAMKSAADAYGAASQAMGGVDTGLGSSALGGRGIDGAAGTNTGGRGIDGKASADVGKDSNALGGAMGLGGGYVDAGSLGVTDSDVSASGKNAGAATSAEKGAADAASNDAGSKADAGDKGGASGSDGGGSGGTGAGSGGLGSSKSDKSDNDKGGRGRL